MRQLLTCRTSYKTNVDGITVRIVKILEIFSILINLSTVFSQVNSKSPFVIKSSKMSKRNNSDVKESSFAVVLSPLCIHSAPETSLFVQKRCGLGRKIACIFMF